MSAALLRTSCLGFIAGVALVAYGRPSFFVLVVALMCTAFAVVIVPHKNKIALVVVFASAVGALWMHAFITSFIATVPQIEIAAQKGIAFHGTVEDSASKTSALVVRLDEPSVFRGYAISFQPRKEQLGSGDRLRFTCVPYTDTLQEIPAWQLARRQLISCKTISLIKQDAPSATMLARNHIKQAIIARFQSVFDHPTAGFYSALLLGDRADVSQRINDAFKSTGTTHILAISGFHLSFMGLILGVLLQGLLLSPRQRFVVLALFFISYMWLVGFSPSVVRSVVFALATMIAYCLGRRRNAFHIIIVSAAGFLIADPFSIYSVSYLLSFTAIAALIEVVPYVEHCIRFIKWDDAREALALGFGPAIATAPIIMSFAQVPLITPVANMFAVPLSPLMMAGGIITPLVSLVAHAWAEWLGQLFNYACDGMIRVLTYLGGLLPTIGGALSVLNNGMIYAWLCVAGLLFWRAHKFSLAKARIMVYTKE